MINHDRYLLDAVKTAKHLRADLERLRRAVDKTVSSKRSWLDDFEDTASDDDVKKEKKEIGEILESFPEQLRVQLSRWLKKNGDTG